jgi:hypothetical protein
VEYWGRKVNKYRRFIKMKRLIIATIIALMAIVPLTGAASAAGNTFWQGTAAVTNTEPISIELVSGDGVFDATAHTWSVSSAGGGTVNLVLKAKNNSTTPYTVNAVVLPAPTTTGVSASWSPASKNIVAGGEQDFTLTVIVAPNAPIIVNNYNISFSR